MIKPENDVRLAALLNQLEVALVDNKPVAAFLKLEQLRDHLYPQSSKE